MQEKSINRYRSFCRSLQNLAEAKGKDASDKFVLSGTVQMFNLAFDLSWKVMKDIITEYHVKVLSINGRFYEKGGSILQGAGIGC